MVPTSLLAAETAERYTRAWNAHDGAEVAACFAEDGTYLDPTLPVPLPRAAVAGMVAGLVAAFPDLVFAGEDLAVDGNRVFARWRLQGTNTGPLPGLPQPTGARCDLPGIDVITVDDTGITSVVGYFDQKTFAEQLGLRALVVPGDAPPVRFGFSARTELGRTQVPGALAMTTIAVREGEEDELNARTGAIVEALAGDPDFLGIVATNGSGRGHTFTAWASPEAAERAVAAARPHRDAVARVEDGFGTGGSTGIWVPHRLNPQWARCPGCGGRVRFPAGAATAACRCGGEVRVSAYL
ncbi:conserved hypothetical protein, steroid delta-isomerase-related [Geodermatophilus saharensis]|uniref:SnoaL-like domain-containing protein n=1 Tax=Geodermatophilus saharensis TaxID=1137994 RepID=A0A239ECG9_9ACTN|nr:nuclear transport factor 2 family protein [Geodermatophilus saharensis]SNS42307.1 conserved hypothetical protein, steroid delta-isomerase-related [Geodermatophilus saharensis]